MVVAVLASSETGSVLSLVGVNGTRSKNLVDSVKRLTAGVDGFVLEGNDGTVFEGKLLSCLSLQL